MSSLSPVAMYCAISSGLNCLNWTSERDTAESTRSSANTWTKAAGNFDGFIDFDAAITDGKTGDNEPAMQSKDAMWSQADGLHPGPAGYKAMGEAVSLSLFAP